MATYLLFGRYSADALKGISAKRSDDARALIKKHGGELKAAYATLGGIDLVMIADLPDNSRAIAASTALAKLHSPPRPRSRSKNSISWWVRRIQFPEPFVPATRPTLAS